MSNLICKKCGATATSKCPRTRGVFPDNQDMSYLKNILNVRVTKNDTTLSLDYIVPEGATPEQALDTLLRIFDRLSQASRKQLMCHCEWIMQPGQTCLFGCCTGEPVDDKTQTKTH